MLAFARSCMLACAIRGQLRSMSERDLPSREQLLCGRCRWRISWTGEKLWLEAGLPRLTRVGIPIKLEESNRGCPDPREGAAVRFYSSPLGGRPIGRTPDSGSGYPGSSPGLPAKISTIKLGCSGLVVARACDFAFRWRAVV